MFRSLQKYILVFGLSVISWHLSAGFEQAEARADHQLLSAVLIFDTADPKIGDTVKKDRENWQELLNAVFRKHPEKLRLMIIDTAELASRGIEVTPDFILGNIRQFASGNPSQEAFFVYFSGHGGFDPKRGQLLSLSQGRHLLYRSQLRDALEETNPTYALRVLITDCCANNVTADNQPERRVAEWPVFQQLFFQQFGLVDINAAEEGMLSFSNSGIGSFFTFSLVFNLCQPIETLDFNGDGFINWSEMFRITSQQTNEIWRAVRGQNSQQTHFAKAYVLGSADGLAAYYHTRSKLCLTQWSFDMQLAADRSPLPDLNSLANSLDTAIREMHQRLCQESLTKSRLDACVWFMEKAIETEPNRKILESYLNDYEVVARARREFLQRLLHDGNQIRQLQRRLYRRKP